MRVHRGSLFWGLFLLLLGAIPLLDRQGVIDVDQFTELGRLWPLAIIAVGVAVLVSRTQLALLGTALAAVILGGLAGSAIAAGGGFILNVGDCGTRSSAAMEQLTREGTLQGGSAVKLDFSCGTLDVTTSGDDAWRLEADYRGASPSVDASPSRLVLETPSGGVRRHEWSLVLPRDRIANLEAAVNAGSGTIDVGNASLDRLSLRANAGDVVVLADGTSIVRLDVAVNAGRVRLDLGGPIDGIVSVNAGSIDVCVPADADLRLTVREQVAFGTNLSQRGLARNGELWQRAGSGGPVIRLEISGNAGSFNLDPSGGCR